MPSLNWKGVEIHDVTTTDVDRLCKPRLQPQWSTRNGQLVSAEFQGSVSLLANQIARYRPKMYARGGGDVTAPVADKHWRFAGCFGPAAGSMVVRLLMAPADQSSSASNPYVRLNVYDTSDTLIATARAHFGASYGIPLDEAPSEWGVMTIGVDVRDYRETCFRAEIIANEEARPISFVAYESTMPATTENAYVNSTYSVGQPILDTDRRHVQDLAVSLYKYGGPSLFHFMSETDATAPEASSTTHASILDSGTPNQEPAGFHVDLRFSNRKTKTMVPVRVECCAMVDESSVGSGEVRVVDSAGNVYATFSVTNRGPSPAWQTAVEAELPADERMYFVEHCTPVLDTITTFCVSVYRYQS
jgi:hypothetical protein